MLLLLLLLLPFLAPSTCEWLDPSVFKQNAPSCYNISIPYPFGITGKYSLGLEHLDSFGIICTGDALMLPLPSGQQYKIVDISLPQGTITILGSAITWRCPFGTTPHDLNFSLEGTPFTFSDTRNKFTVVGCDALAMMEDVNGSYPSACAAFCVSTKAVVEGLCSGVGCCQAPVPKALKRLTLNFTSIRGQIGVTKLEAWESCSKAFLAKEDEYVFSSGDLFNNQNLQTRPVVLEWSIGNQSCAEMNSRNGTMCKANSNCYNSTNGIGYRCNCTQGFEGNPYLTPGCVDINECHGPNNPCIDPNRCSNTIGGFICTCPLGRNGDGTLHGSGCKHLTNLKPIILIGMGMGIGLLIVIQSLNMLIKRIKTRRRNKIREKLFKQNHGLLLQQLISSNRYVSEKLKILTLQELEKATNKFDQTRIVGQGGHGIVYKGILEDQRVVAIKMSQIVIQREIDQFINEVVILSQIDHRNVVKLFGCCLESEVPLLVYEFISNGTLFEHLHVEGYHFLSWEDRFRIMLEIARALAHLHSTASISVFHRDIKSSNVLLDDYLTAKVSDFGASRSIQIDQTGITTEVQGTYGYLDPEYYYTGRLTEKSDVYSFGVILAELLTSEKPTSSSRFQEGENLASHFCSAIRENYLKEILNPEITEEENIVKIEAVAGIAEMCLRMKGEERPTMKEVETRLEVLHCSKNRQVHPWAATERFDLHERLVVNNGSNHHDDTTRLYSIANELMMSSSFPR